MRIAILGSGPILQNLTSRRIDSYDLVVCINRAILRYVDLVGYFIPYDKVLLAALDVHFLKGMREDYPKIAPIKVLTLASRARQLNLEQGVGVGVVRYPNGNFENATADLEALERKDGLFTITHALTYAKGLNPRSIDLWVDWAGEADYNGKIPQDVNRSDNRWDREREQVLHLLEANVNFVDK